MSAFLLAVQTVVWNTLVCPNSDVILHTSNILKFQRVRRAREFLWNGCPSWYFKIPLLTFHSYTTLPFFLGKNESLLKYQQSCTQKIAHYPIIHSVVFSFVYANMNLINSYGALVMKEALYNLQNVLK